MGIAIYVVDDSSTQGGDDMTVRTISTRTALMAIAGLVALLLGATGCDRDSSTDPEGNAPDPEVAASLAATAQTAATVGINLDQVDIFANPLAGISEDAGLYQDTDPDGWDVDGMGFPEKAEMMARDFRTVRAFNGKIAASPRLRASMLERSFTMDAWGEFQQEDGDTIDVEYFDGPDSTGLNALIWVDVDNDIVRFVKLREYTPVIGRIVRRDQEHVFDINGTLEDGSDDIMHSFFSEEEWFGGEVDTGTLMPVSGSGPMGPGIEVQAVWHVEDPRFHPLQEWTEVSYILDVGEFNVEGDELIYSIEATVHWRNDAEHRAMLDVPGGGPIENDTLVEARGQFDAAPANPWLESVSDTLNVMMGDLEDDADDLLVEVSRRSVFDGTAIDGGNPRGYIHYVPDEPIGPGEEPCGAEAEHDVWYSEDWWVVHVLREVDVECDGPDTLHVLMEFRDGSSYERWIIWDDDGNAEVTENRVDGTVVSGTWNATTGDYTINTTFPAGSDPTAREQRGQVQEGSVEAWDILTWTDGRPDTTFFSGQGDETAFDAEGFKVKGDLREEFTLEYQEDALLAGTWARNDGAEGEFTIETLEGGSQHVTFASEAPAEPGEPSIEGEIWVAPDGSGTGTVRITQYGQTVTYEITFGPDGEGFLSDGTTEIPIG